MCDDLTSYNASWVKFKYGWVDDHYNDLSMGAELTGTAMSVAKNSMVGIINELTFWDLPLGIFQI